MKTTPVNITGTNPDTNKPFRPTSHLVISSKDLTDAKLKDLEETLFGSEGTASYSAVSPVGTENPTTEGWYERSGSDPNYVYTLTTDTTVNNEKTYYSKTITGASDPKLPTPDEVIALLSSNG